MREIKFRAWNKKKNAWDTFITEFVDYENKKISLSIPENSHLIIMQFTGLHDKNGKEIYFDDFVKAPSDNIFQVIWYDEEMRIALKHKDTIYNFNVGLYEVIGNIYETPELVAG